MPESASFCCIFICNLHTIASGRPRTMTSRIRFAMPLILKNWTSLMHDPLSIVLSQKKATGVH